MRLGLVLGSIVVLAAPLVAQDLKRPEGWMTRFDRADMSEEHMEMFVAMPPGWHITTGHAAGIFYDPKMTASGEYTLSVKMHLFNPGERRREGYGIFFGGRDLQGENQTYSYFLLRDTGHFIVKKRSGAQAPTVEAWKASDAIKPYASGSSVPNVLEVRVAADSVRFFVNGQHLTSVAKGELSTDGVYGFRVNHALNLHAEPFQLKVGMREDSD